MNNQQKLKGLRTLISTILIAILLIGCTDERPPSFPDGQGEDVISKDLLTGTEINVTTVNEQKSVQLAASLISNGEITKAKVIDSDAPAELKPMFKNLEISGVGGNPYKIILSLDKHNITAYRVVDNPAKLPLQEQDIIEEDATKAGRMLLPLFQYGIDSYGVLEKTKDGNDEETSTLRLKETKFEEATHFKADLDILANRTPVQVDDETAKEIYPLKKIHGKVMSAAKIKAAMNVPLALASKSSVFTEINGAQNKVVFYSLASVDDLSTAEKSLLGGEGNILTECTALVKSQLGSDIAADKCIMRLHGSAPYSYVEVERKKHDFDGTMEADIVFKSSNTPTKLIKVVKDVMPDELNLELTLQAQKVLNLKNINGLVLSAEEIKQNLNIPLALESDEKLFSKVSGNQILFYALTSIDNLTALEKAQLGEKGILTKCSAEIKKQLPKAEAKKCVMKLHSSTAFTYLAITREKDQFTGAFIPKVKIDTSAVATDLIKLAGSQAVEVDLQDLLDKLNPGNMVALKDLKGEFLFRRTMQDSPNGFNYTFAGSSGDLEIVSFKFSENTMKIVRAKPLLTGDGVTNVDLEIMMSIPVDYYVKKIFRDSKGQKLEVPRFVTTEHTDPKAIARINWSNNQIPNINSPLAYYGLEQCFTGARNKVVSGVDQRLGKDGIINFSLSSTYVLEPSLMCSGVANVGYFDRVQTSFTFKERISFKKYNQENETPLLGVPYEAQKLLGFGLFTYKKDKPNENGNIGTDGTEVALPAVFDLSENKKITYVLAGIPDSGEVRTRIIKATQEVVADLNEGFKKAFKGTEKERDGDVIELKIEGVDIAKGQLGDLDKNYIYYVPKQTSSRVIGLGGAHANPRSGVVEAASVFVYGGNIMSMVESLKKIAKAKAEYESATAVAAVEETNEAAGGDVTAPAPNSSSDASALRIPNMDSELAGMLESPMIQGKIVDVKSIVAMAAKKPVAFKRDIHNYADLLKHVGIGNEETKAQILSELPKSSKGLALYNAIQKGINEQSLQNPMAMEALVNDSLLDSMQSSLSRDEYAELKARTRGYEALSKVMGKMRKQGICLYDSAEASHNLANVDGRSDIDLLVAVYKPTLAHEIGHNLGLRHNFIASYDKQNWKHTEDEETTRNYSSVMDYLSDDHDTYDGVGPQDVAALRAAYAGLIELSPESAQAVAGAGAAELVDGKFVAIEDYRKLLGLDSWLYLNQDEVNKLPLKGFKFCSDEDAGYYPLCNRFDAGTTPLEIVQNRIHDYKSLYTLVNFPGDKLNFGLRGTGGYIGRLFSRFTPIRQMVEETIYQLITGQTTGPAIGDYVNAVVEGMSFFHSIIRTPDMAGLATDPAARFIRTTDDQGKEIVVEKKWLNDQGFGFNSDRLRVRGIEFDKVIAMILLTERRMGFPRYESISLRMSFPEFERLLFRDAPAQNTPTIALLTELLNNNISAATTTADGLSLLGGQFKVDTTEMIRLYGVLGSIANLDVDGLESSDNNSSLFRVLNGFDLPEGKLSVVQPGGDKTNADELKYWAMQGSGAVSGIVTNINNIAEINKKKAELSKGVADWVIAVITEQQAEAGAGETDAGETGAGEGTTGTPDAGGDGATEVVAAEGDTPPPADGDTPPVEQPEQPPLKESEKIAKQLDEILVTLPESIQPRDMASIGGFVMQVINLAAQIQQGAEIMPVEDLQNLLESIAKQQPILAMAMEAIPAEAIGLTLLEQIKPQVNDRQQLIQFRNIEMINNIFFTLHPEFKR